MLGRSPGAALSADELAALVPLPESFDATKPIEITFWAKNDTNKTQTEIYQKAIRDFQALYPNVTVNLRLYTDYGKIYNDVITNIATDTTPNVCITYPDHIATYLTGEDVVLPLDAWFADPAFGLGGSELKFDSPRQDEIVPEFLAECVLEGAHYAIPFMRSTEACYVNKTFVEKLGYELPEVLTWDFVWEVSEAAMEKDADGNFKVNGQKVMIPFIYKSTDNMMIQMLRQKGAGYSTADGRDPDLQRHHEGAALHHRRARRERRLLHLQDLQLSGQLPQRRPVHLRRGLHRRRHLDGHRRAAGGHRARPAGGV